MKENSISERRKEDTDGEQDLCQASGRYLTIMLTICLQGGKWDLTAASGSNHCRSTRTCARVGAICSPSDGLCNQGSALRSCKGDSAGAAAYYRGLTKTLSTRPAVTDEVKWLRLIYSPSCQSKDEFYFGLHGLVSSLSVKTTSMVSHCFIWLFAAAKKIYH